MENSSVLIWDFFGRSAAPTAEHFKIHLEEFLAKHALAAQKIELLSEDSLHMGVRCHIADLSTARQVAKTLRAGRRSMLGPLCEDSEA